VKSRSHSVRSEVLKVLLALRIKDINLEKEKVDEMKQKKFMKHKQKLLTLSKKERKVCAFMICVIKVSVLVLCSAEW
jgi:nucleolar complex protein 3